MSEPLITVIIPAFNAEATLARALDSISRQVLLPDQIIVVDDGSTDATSAVAMEHPLPVELFSQPNSGPAAARNTGIGAARGKYLAFLDADDEWLPEKLAIQSKLLSSCDVAIGQCILSDDARVGTSPSRAGTITVLGALLSRRMVFDSVGKFDTTMRLSEDTDWILRVRDAGLRIVFHNEVVLRYHRRMRSLTYGKSLLDVGFLDAVRRSIRRRANPGTQK